ncbi:c-type cytochrome [Rhodocyclaceae bacterium SMB388]
MKKLTTLLISGALLFAFNGTATATVDEADAEKLLKSSKCSRCHEVDKVKKGKPFAQTAADYKGNPDAVAEVIAHISKPSKVEVDGEKVDHGTVKTRDADRIRNLAEWILSR